MQEPYKHIAGVGYEFEQRRFVRRSTATYPDVYINWSSTVLKDFSYASPHNWPELYKPEIYKRLPVINE